MVIRITIRRDRKTGRGRIIFIMVIGTMVITLIRRTVRQNNARSLPSLALTPSLSVCQSVCPSVGQSVDRLVFLSVCLSVCLPACPSVCSVCSVRPAGRPSVRPSVRSSVRLSVRPSVCLSLSLSLSLSLYLSLFILSVLIISNDDCDVCALVIFDCFCFSIDQLLLLSYCHSIHYGYDAFLFGNGLTSTSKG